MPLDSVSRGPLQVQQPTLEDVRQAIVADAGLAPRRRQDLSSGLLTIARALGRPLQETLADPGRLFDRLEDFTPAMAGVSEGRWRNAVCYARAALKHANLAKVPGRYDAPLSPQWAELFTDITDKRIRIGLSRLARYCSVDGIAPEAVDDGIMGRFLSDLEASMVKNPRSIGRTACLQWNRATAAIPSWPQQKLLVPNYRNTYVLPWSTFPASLKTELDAYLDRLAGKDIFAELDFRPLKPGSLKTRASQLREFVSGLVHRGRDPQTLRSLADLVAVETVKQGLAFFLDRPDGGAKKHAHDIAGVLRSMARYQVRVDAPHLEKLKAICHRIDPGRRGLTERNRARLLPFEDPDNVRAVLRLPERIMADISRDGSPTRAQALEVQTAVAIAILVMLPLRIGNLASLDLDRHIRRVINSRVVHLTIPAAEVKNGVDIAAQLPEPTVRLIDLYVRRYRPMLAKIPSRSLFPGESGKPKSIQSLRLQITKSIKRRCGLLVHPHLFRHFAGMIYLKAHPGAYGVVQRLHGHKCIETTIQNYCGMETAAAIQHFDDYVLKLKGPPMPDPTGSKSRGRS
jgi:integrase